MKKFIALLLALVMVLSLTACVSGDNPTDTANPSQNPTGNPVTSVDPTEISEFKEAPYITNLGTYGKVEDRLPVKADIKVETASYLSIGKYGGELHRTTTSSSWATGKPIEEGLFLFNADGSIENNVAKSWEANADYTVYTIHLREGMKWSDGEPFTAEDCVWFYNVICLNNLDGKGIRSCHKDADGNPAKVEKVDNYTFTVTFGTPKYDFVEMMEVDLKWHWAPKHIFEDLTTYMLESKNAADDDAKKEADAKAVAEGEKICGTKFADANAVGKELFYYFWNYPGVPTLNSFVLSTESGKNNVKGDYYEYVRNPYYWKVDAAGNQLPYIDKITYTTIQSAQQGVMLLLDGTEDFQVLGIKDIATITETANANINIYAWPTTSWGDATSQIHFNLNIADPNLNALFNNADFRQAVSICVDREKYAKTVTDGWTEGGQAAPQPGTQGYSEEWAKQWTEYDVEKAKTLLEGCGLKKGADGYYDFADGTDLTIHVKAVADDTGTTADHFALLKLCYDAVGINTTYREYDRSVIDNDITANEVECIFFPVTPIGDVSIALKPNSMVPGTATNSVWYGTMKKDNATGDLLALIELKEKLDKTGDLDERAAIQQQMLDLHQKNQWTIAYVAAESAYFAVNARIKNFPPEGVKSDIYRDDGLAHCWCWYIEE